ncbi:hypothetical protein FRB99_000092 [Tulasnella sp. 403]|nr:hypothetical protein FRB99_000092 [Tulasnella sp. 403]
MSQNDSPRATARPTSQPSDDKIRETTNRIREELQKLHLDDVASLANQQRKQSSIILSQISWFEQSIANSIHYIRYLIITWGNFFNHFSAGGSLTLAVIWLWCFISTAPPLVWAYQLSLLGRNSYGLGLVNSSNPNIFLNLTPKQCEAAKEKLAEEPSPGDNNPRTFSLDIAKMLLQIASLMYERDDDLPNLISVVQNALTAMSPLSRATNTSPTAADPGRLFTTLIGASKTNDVAGTVTVQQIKGSKTISNWASEYGICYQPVSELASLSQAYCSLFWDPRSTWVVVAFKGTDPRSFEEWTTDFTAQFSDAEKDIPGFRKVHRGFKERIFPSNLDSDDRQPWETISAAIKIVTDGLASLRAPGTKCNVWFTGHSLGTALATLAYSRALMAQDIGENARLRDAYLFATPITTDVTSRDAFNRALQADKNVVRTMWRVTNRDDVVATGLPALGDNAQYTLSSSNLFGFAHLGVEIFMKSYPRPCEVYGRRLNGLGDHDIHVSSKFTAEEVVRQRRAAVANGLNVKRIYLALQYIPVVGRLVAHASTNYYDQLDQIALKGCIDRE